ncbi:hypothetical protein AB4086_02285 [Vibrio splendidus]
MAGIDVKDSTVKFMGYSLGGITGFTSVATSEIAGTHKFSSAVYANSGGHIGDLLFASKIFDPEIKYNLAKQLNATYRNSVASACTTDDIEDGDCYTAFAKRNPTSAVAIETELVAFKVAAQTLIDTVDPHSLANIEDLSSFSSSYPTLLIQLQNDETVLNNG